jgi:hypothetical protein
MVMPVASCGQCGNPVGLLSIGLAFRDGRNQISVCRTCWNQEYGSPEAGTFPVEAKQEQHRAAKRST